MTDHEAASRRDFVAGAVTIAAAAGTARPQPHAEASNAAPSTGPRRRVRRRGLPPA